MGEAFASYTSERLKYRIYKELQNSNTKKILPVNKWTIKIDRQISKEETQMANEYFRRVQHHQPSGQYKLKLFGDSISPSQSGDRPGSRQQTLVRMQGKRNSFLLVVGVQTSEAIVETSMEGLDKLKLALSSDPAIPLLGITSRTLYPTVET